MANAIVPGLKPGLLCTTPTLRDIRRAGPWLDRAADVNRVGGAESARRRHQEKCSSRGHPFATSPSAHFAAWPPAIRPNTEPFVRPVPPG